ncbi:phosphatidylglycerophosphatase A family protein [Wenxinia marina]|uniref:Phosphatidylglycerophosphatase A n=1 Tax=Wenxinia marina DSM 24838 TaxID=1123501 RepID=A0A0D0Q9C2_9RHOB|nr:phosphatidylglycerophosphatase A [Wenxinia marina]KIQ67648.1 Phosphatidylglycerophosphatase A [Wenxinia marina DSM 24838]
MRWIAVFFGAGLMRPGPGTWGSLAALVVALPLLWIGGPFLLLAATVLAIAVGLPAIREEVAASGAEDPSHVVIDEVAGQWIALMPVAFGAWHVGAAYTALWPGWVAASLLFRLFDIWKPGPVGWADRRGDVWGVMGDDLIAGAIAAVGVVILAALFHVWLLA